MSDPARVLEDALGLEPTHRARIARELIESLEQGDADAEALWRAEITRRIDEIEAGTAELEDWDAVRGRLRAAVRR
jgi:putative addiction module component (TIGR02574 family)